MGSWLTYGLGSENQDLPASSCCISGENNPDGGKALLGQRLPAHGLPGRPVPRQGRPDPLRLATRTASTDATRRESLDLDPRPERAAARRASATRRSRPASPRTRWRSGCRSSVPELMDIAEEPARRPRAVRHRAGQGVVRQQLPARPPAGRARRALRPALSPGLGHHGDRTATTSSCACRDCASEIDRACGGAAQGPEAARAARRTLVIWGGEFGRTPMNEARNGSKLLGRDHHPARFTMWMAGGGIKPGHHPRPDRRPRLPRRRGSGPRPRPARDDPAPDGLDHEKLTYKFQGRDFRLTDVSENSR